MVDKSKACAYNTGIRNTESICRYTGGNACAKIYRLSFNAFFDNDIIGIGYKCLIFLGKWDIFLFCSPERQPMVFKADE